MKLYVKCGRCHGELEVDTQTVANAAAMGDELKLEHAPGGCPNEGGVPQEIVQRRFRAQVILVELPPPGDPKYDELGINEEEVVKGFAIHFPDATLGNAHAGFLELEALMGVGKTVTARNAAEAVNGPLTTWLTETWPKMQENAAFADVPASPGSASAPTPTTDAQVLP